MTDSRSEAVEVSVPLSFRKLLPNSTRPPFKVSGPIVSVRPSSWVNWPPIVIAAVSEICSSVVRRTVALRATVRAPGTAIPEVLPSRSVPALTRVGPS